MSTVCCATSGVAMFSNNNRILVRSGLGPVTCDVTVLCVRCAVDV